MPDVRFDCFANWVWITKTSFKFIKEHECYFFSFMQMKWAFSAFSEWNTNNLSLVKCKQNTGKMARRRMGSHSLYLDTSATNQVRLSLVKWMPFANRFGFQNRLSCIEILKVKEERGFQSLRGHPQNWTAYIVFTSKRILQEGGHVLIVLLPHHHHYYPQYRIFFYLTNTCTLYTFCLFGTLKII
jgi:hypothetical protein